MPKDLTRPPPKNYYAVLHGRYGPYIYTNVREYNEATRNFSGCSGRGFYKRQDAVDWLLTAARRAKIEVPVHIISSVSIPITIYTHSPNPLFAAAQAPTKRYAEAGMMAKQYIDVATQCPPLLSITDMPVRQSGILKMIAPRKSLMTSLGLCRPMNPPTQPSVQLSEEQKSVLDDVMEGTSLFFTGPAGTGKSVLLREIIRKLRQDSNRPVAVTATTGIAGLNVQGSTIHSFAGVGFGTDDTEVLINKIVTSHILRGRWTKTQVLLIDEVSMMDGRLFDKLEEIARRVRGNDLPFGGIQLVISGDFFQLPPVPDKDANAIILSKYAFQARTWTKCIRKVVFLSRVFRQTDNEFIELLHNMRYATLSPVQIATIHGLARPVVYDDGIEPSQLFPLKKKVHECNERRLAELEGETVSYKAMDSRGCDARGHPLSETQAMYLLQRNMIAPEELLLKIGAQVMLISNVEQGQLVNGCVGKVTRFATVTEAKVKDIPVAELFSERKPPEEDEKYRLTPINGHVFSASEKWPVVEFKGGRPLLCRALPFDLVSYNGKVEAHRVQVPLILAWALSIHKSQGQTLERVRVDLRGTFEKGQAYVALSRATTLKHLEVYNFEPSKVKADEIVIQWQDQWLARRELEIEMDTEEAISRYWDISEMGNNPLYDLPPTITSIPEVPKPDRTQTPAPAPMIWQEFGTQTQAQIVPYEYDASPRRRRLWDEDVTMIDASQSATIGHETRETTPRREQPGEDEQDMDMDISRSQSTAPLINFLADSHLDQAERLRRRRPDGLGEEANRISVEGEISNTRITPQPVVKEEVNFNYEYFGGGLDQFIRLEDAERLDPDPPFAAHLHVDETQETKQGKQIDKCEEVMSLVRSGQVTALAGPPEAASATELLTPFRDLGELAKGKEKSRFLRHIEPGCLALDLPLPPFPGPGSEFRPLSSSPPRQVNGGSQ